MTTGEFLSILTKFRNVTTFSLKPDTSKAFIDKHLPLIAQAFPRLHSLTLYAVRVDQPKATFCGIAHLLRGCSHLKHLSLAIDATTGTNAWCKETAINVRSAAMVSWDISGSLIDDPEFAARVIAKMMPNLYELGEASRGTPRTSRLWRRVKFLVDVERIDYIRRWLSIT